jgi:hypothetical protein
MTTIAQLGIDLSLNSAKFVTELGKAQATLNNNTSSMKSSLSSLEKGFSGLQSVAATIGIGLGVGAIAELARTSLLGAANIGIMAKQLDVSTDAIQAFQLASAQAGVGSEVLDINLRRLTASIGQAVQGNDVAIKGFNAMGVGVLDAGNKTRSTEAVFEDIAAAYLNAGNKAQFAANMKMVLGREAQRLIPIFGTLSGALADTSARLSPDLVKAAEEAEAKLGTLETKFTLLGEKIMAFFAPILEKSASGWDMLLFGGSSNEEKISVLVARMSLVNNEISEISFNIRQLGIGGIVPKAWTQQLQDDIAKSDELSKKIAALRDQQKNPAAPNTGSDSAGAHNPQSESISKVNEALQNEIEKQHILSLAVGDSAEQIARINGFYEGLNTLIAQKIDLNSKEGQQIVNLSVQKAVEIERTQAATKGYTDFAAAMVAEVAKRDALHQKAEDAIADIQRQVDQNHLEAESIGLTAGQLAELNAQRALQNKLLTDHNQFSPEELAHAQAVTHALRQSTDELDRMKKATEELGNFADTAFNNIGQAIDTAIMQKGISAFNSLKNIALSVISEIEGEFIKLGAINPLEKALGLPGSQNLPTLDSLFGLIFGGGGVSGADQNLLLGDVGMFHSGGVVGQATSSRAVPASAFARAPRMHSGGFIGPGEVPIIARQGERVLTPKQQAAGGSSPLTVNLSIMTGVQQTVRAEIMQMMPTISKHVGKAVTDARLRGATKSLG